MTRSLPRERFRPSVVVAAHGHLDQSLGLGLRLRFGRSRRVPDCQEVEEGVDVRRDDESASRLGERGRPLRPSGVNVDKVLEEVELRPGRDLLDKTECEQVSTAR